jgi:hypothetical protein
MIEQCTPLEGAGVKKKVINRAGGAAVNVVTLVAAGDADKRPLLLALEGRLSDPALTEVDLGLVVYVQSRDALAVVTILARLVLYNARFALREGIYGRAGEAFELAFQDQRIAPVSYCFLAYYKEH